MRIRVIQYEKPPEKYQPCCDVIRDVKEFNLFLTKDGRIPLFYQKLLVSAINDLEHETTKIEIVKIPEN